MGHPAVFLDKDGTLIPDIPYNVDPNKIELTRGATQGLQLLDRAGYQLIVISNQSGVARGYFSESALSPVFQRLQQLLDPVNVTLTDFYYCPHYPSGIVGHYAIECDCRKPQPGLLLKAAEKHDLDLQRSWMIGDILNDVEAGRKAGCSTILINNGNETEWMLTPDRIPHYRAANLLEAARIIQHVG